MDGERVRLKNCPFCGGGAWAVLDADEGWHLATEHDRACLLWPLEDYVNEIGSETWWDAAEEWERRAS